MQALELAVQPDRSTYIGSSDIAAILGLSPWKTPYAVWEHKVYGIEEPVSPEKEQLYRRGKRMEPVILDMLTEEEGLWLPRRNVRYVDPEFSFLQCELDAEAESEETGEVWPVEAKSVSVFAAKDWGEPRTDEVPTYYLAQTQFALGIHGGSHTTVAALIGSDDFRPYNVNRDSEFIVFARDEAVRFWTHNVQKKIPPPLKDATDAAKMLAKFDGVTMQATDELRTAAKRLLGARKAIGRLEKLKTSCEDTLKIALATCLDGDGEQTPGKTAIVGETGAPLVTWNEQARAGYTVAPTTYRVMRISKEIAA